MNSINQDVNTLKNTSDSGSISAGAISGENLSETVTLFGSSIQSNNYAPGSAGWKIDGTGVAEFADVYVRGDINAETGTIGYWNISPVDATRHIGTDRIFGTFLESAQIGINDDAQESGVYVALYKTYFEDTLPVTDCRRTANVATITVPGHTYQAGDYINVLIDQDSTFNASPIAVRVDEVTEFTVSYENIGANFPIANSTTGILPSTAVTGTAQYYQKDSAGIFVRDYGKVDFDYGYFSSEGIKFSAGETVNLVQNPSFEYDSSTPLSDAWNITDYLTNTSDVAAPSVEIFSTMRHTWNILSHSYAGLTFPWSANTYDSSVDYILGTVDAAGADRFKLFDESVDRPIYLNTDVYFHESVEEIPIDDTVVPTITSTTVTLTSGYTAVVASAVGNSAQNTYTMAVAGEAPDVGQVVTITGMLPTGFNKSNATVLTSNGTVFTLSGGGVSSGSTTQAGDLFVGSGLAVGDVIHTGNLKIIGYSSTGTVTDYAKSPTGEQYFVVTSVPSVRTFTIANLYGTTPVIGTGYPDPAYEFDTAIASVNRPMRGSQVTSVTVPGASFDSTTSADSETPSIATKVFTVTNSGSYAVGHRVLVFLTDDDTVYMAGVITALTTNSSISVKVDDFANDPGGAHAGWTFSILYDYYSTSSTSSLSIATGSKTFLTSFTGSYRVGVRVRVTSDSDANRYMIGNITAVSINTSITVSVDKISGSGTYADWTFEPLGDPDLDITLVFSGGHDFTEDDSLYLDFSVLDTGGFDYTDSYTGIGQFVVTVLVSSTAVKVQSYNGNPETTLSAVVPTAFINNSNFVRPTAAYAVSGDYYDYSIEAAKIQFPNGQVKNLYDVLSAKSATEWPTVQNSSVPAYEYIYNILSSTVGLTRLPTPTLELSSIKLMAAYKALDPTAWALKSNFYIRVPVGITNSGLYPLISKATPQWPNYVSSTLDNIGLTTGIEFFFGGDEMASSSWADPNAASTSLIVSAYSVGSADNWVDVSVDAATSSLDHTSTIGFKSTTSSVLWSNANISAGGSNYSTRELVFDNTGIGGWYTGKIVSPSFGRSLAQNNFQASLFSDYSVTSYTSGEALTFVDANTVKYAGSSVTSYTNSTISGNELISYKQTMDVSGTMVANKVASIGTWVDSNDVPYISAVSDYVDFRSLDGTKRTLTGGYTANTTGALKKKRVVNIDAPLGYVTVSDLASAPHVMYRRSTSTTTTTSTTANPGTVALAGYFRTGASGQSLINFGARVDNTDAGVSTGTSVRVRLGSTADGVATTTGTLQTLSVPELLSTGTESRVDSGTTIFFGKPHTTYYIETLIWTTTASTSTASAYDRHIVVTPIV